MKGSLIVVAFFCVGCLIGAPVFYTQCFHVCVVCIDVASWNWDWM